MQVQKFFKYWKIISLGILAGSNIFIWYVVQQSLPSKYLTVAFLNIGQGDAIYIESPTHNQIMIDGGPSKIVLSELRKVMPFYDRSIDTLLVTNPDTDHYAGFIDILNQYHIHRIIEPGTLSPSATYKTFEELIKEKSLPKVVAQRGMIIHLGNGADIKILFPDHDVSGEKTNDGSIIAKLSYGSTTVMFTGDAPNKTEEQVLALDSKEVKEDDVQSILLKAGHHGSRTSASESFVQAVSPEYAIISAGVHNKYGHPHKETLDLFKKLGVQVLGTYDRGMITLTSDGKDFTITTEK